MLNTILNIISGRGAIPTSPEEALPELAKWKKSAFRLHPYSLAKTSLGSSKVGGQFIAPINSVLPVCPEHGATLINLLQIMGKDIEHWDKSLALQIFWCPRDHAETHCPYLYIRNVKISDSEVISSAPAAGAEDNYIPKQCTVKLQKITEYPSVFELSESISQQVKLVKKWARWGRKLFGSGYEDYASYFYQNYLSTAPGWKVGGWCDWVQAAVNFNCEQCGGKMEHLVTIGSQMFDGATRFRWGKRRRERGYDETNIMIGDCGSIFVHHCQKCQTHKWEFQCS
jgi:hypothetical protein